ncbi:porin [Litoribrevibacter euphylliae]|uniref:Porin n=1 Tax=Litoribrevibacter euphylliae TaxID=1834034 RepID=A0ABV7HB29_9GAMM
MKRKLLPFAIAAAVAVPGVALAEATIYGKLNVSLRNVDTSEDIWELESHASRLGFKGDAELDYGLSAIYQLEYEISPDQEDGGSSDDVFKQRDIFVGLKGSFGTFKVGNMDTPLKKAQGKVDLFSDVVDMNILLDGENRQDNALRYTSPKFADMFTIDTMIEVGDGATDEDGNERDGLTEGTSIALIAGDKKYKAQPFYAALAYENDITENKGISIIRAVAGYKINDITLGALYQQSEGELESNEDYDDDGFLLSAAYKMDKVTFKGQYVSSDQSVDSKGPIDGEGGEMFTLGVDYKLGKKTKTYVYYGDGENDADAELTVYGLGLEHKF